jgi:hypothetical protein
VVGWRGALEGGSRPVSASHPGPAAPHAAHLHRAQPHRRLVAAQRAQQQLLQAALDLGAVVAAAGRAAARAPARRGRGVGAREAADRLLQRGAAAGRLRRER